MAWPSMAASASMPPTPQPSTPRPLTIGVWESVPDQRVGIGAALAVGEHHPGQVLEVDLVADAGVGRHDGEAVERRLAPAQELVALAVALELQLGVAAEGVGGAGHVGHDRVVDDQLGRHERVDAAAGRRRASTMASRMAARSTTAGTPVKSCMRMRAGVKDTSRAWAHARVPGGQGLHVVGGDRHAVLVAQQVLQQHLERVGQRRHAAAVLVERVDPVPVGPDLQRALHRSSPDESGPERTLSGGAVRTLHACR